MSGLTANNLFTTLAAKQKGKNLAPENIKTL
jgi:hypothetical protein